TPDMKLYITPGSPYARMARIVVLEKKLESRVEIVLAKTRAAESPYYAINPSGRVPYLVRDDGVGMEESALVCDYLDRLDGRPAFELPSGPAGLEARRLEALARSLLDGLAVWGRELARPRDERSPGVIAHETERARRMVGLWEKEIGHPHMRGRAQHGADDARRRARPRAPQSRFSLAPEASEARGLVRRARGAPLVCRDRAAACL